MGADATCILTAEDHAALEGVDELAPDAHQGLLLLLHLLAASDDLLVDEGLELVLGQGVDDIADPLSVQVNPLVAVGHVARYPWVGHGVGQELR